MTATRAKVGGEAGKKRVYDTHGVICAARRRQRQFVGDNEKPRLRSELQLRHVFKFSRGLAPLMEQHVSLHNMLLVQPYRDV